MRKIQLIALWLVALTAQAQVNYKVNVENAPKSQTLYLVTAIRGNVLDSLTTDTQGRGALEGQADEGYVVALTADKDHITPHATFLLDGQDIVLFWDEEQPRIVELTADELGDKRIIKANNGVLIASVKGNAYEIVANPGNQDKNTKLDPDKDANSYEGNCLMPTIESHNFTPASNYLIMKDNKFHTMSGSGKVPACKAVFSLVKAGVK